jgi:hypothetical protein
MSSVAVPMPSGIGKTDPGQLLKLLGIPAEKERTRKKETIPSQEMLRPVVSIVDDLVLLALQQRTANDFARVRQEVFPQYFAALRALGDLIRIVVPKHTIERLIAESFSEWEADFRELGASTIGADLRDRGLFTIWTLRKISDLSQQVSNLALSDGQKEAERDLAIKFAGYAVWTRFHLDCVVKSMHTKNPIYPEVVDGMVNGLRAAVDAYAWMRQAVDLRDASPEPELTPIPWDEDDELLLADSMRTISDAC